MPARHFLPGPAPRSILDRSDRRGRRARNAPRATALPLSKQRPCRTFRYMLLPGFPPKSAGQRRGPSEIGGGSRECARPRLGVGLPQRRIRMHRDTAGSLGQPKRRTQPADRQRLASERQCCCRPERYGDFRRNRFDLAPHQRFGATSAAEGLQCNRYLARTVKWNCLTALIRLTSAGSNPNSAGPLKQAPAPGPTNGRPWRSSQSPGFSPTSASSASGGP